VFVNYNEMKKIYLVLLILLNSCGLLSESNKPIEYNSESFKDFKPSDPPDYTKTISWAVHPNGDLSIFDDFNQKKQNLPVDVFFIYPTLLTDRNDTSWNADIYDSETRKYVLGSSVKFQASAWFSTGDLYVPFYRQAHFRVFKDSFWKNGG